MDSALRYRRILSAVCAEPWAILPARLADICDVLAYQAMGGKMTAAEVAEYVGIQAAAARPRQESRGALAVLGLRGIVSHRIEAVEDISGPGGTSTERFGQRLQAALDDPQVGHILIDIDSPGGNVHGVPELAAQIRSASKPITAVANATAASAAYWLGSQADEFVVTPSGEVGSVGVFSAHSDLSGALEREGERITLISAGKYKVEGHPFAPLSDEARDAIQSRVDEVYERFVDDVARGRGTTTKAVRVDFGEGRTVTADAALAAGMVDRVETMNETIARLTGTTPGQARKSTARASRSEWDYVFA